MKSRTCPLCGWTQGTIAFLPEPQPTPLPPCMRPLTAEGASVLEPAVAIPSETAAFYLDEASVDPHALVAASLKAARHRDIEVASGSSATELELDGRRVIAVRTTKTRYPAAVNCCGAWASQLPPLGLSTRPIKGQMLALVPARHGLLQHVVRAPDICLVPRSDGHLLAGSTSEDVGFDKHVDPDTVQRLDQTAANLVPDLGEARMLEDWAGLRLGTPDNLPILCSTPIHGYFAATGHYRDPILLSPITAHLMSQVVRGLPPDLDLTAFSLARF